MIIIIIFITGPRGDTTLDGVALSSNRGCLFIYNGLVIQVVQGDSRKENESIFNTVYNALF